LSEQQAEKGIKTAVNLLQLVIEKAKSGNKTYKKLLEEASSN